MADDQIWCGVCLEFHPHVKQAEYDELLTASSKLGELTAENSRLGNELFERSSRLDSYREALRTLVMRVEACDDGIYMADLLPADLYSSPVVERQ